MPRSRSLLTPVAAALLAVLAAACGSSTSPKASGTSQAVASKTVTCPNGGTVNFGVEPYDDQAKMAPLYQPLAQLIGSKLGCTVNLQITSNYTAEIIAMKNKKLDLGEFGPLGYVFAHQVANAQAVATFYDSNGQPDTYYASVVTWPGSGVTSLKQCAAKTFGYSDPASTSGHLMPAYALKSATIDPDKGVQPEYAGSHTASFEALLNHKVMCGELNSQTIASATTSGQYKPGLFTTLWKSAPIPDDPVTVRGDLPTAFKQRVASVLASINFDALGSTVAKGLGDAIGGNHFSTASNSMYAQIASLVKTLNININQLNA